MFKTTIWRFLTCSSILFHLSCAGGPGPIRTDPPEAGPAAPPRPDARQGVDASVPEGPEFKKEIIAVGRALETGDLATAQSLSAALEDSAEGSLLRARIADSAGDYPKAVGHWRALQQGTTDFEPWITGELAGALAKTEQFAEALAKIEPFLADDRALTTAQRKKWLGWKTDWLIASNKHAEVIGVCDELLSELSDKPARQKIALKRAAALIALGKTKPARQVLSPLAQSASRAKIMREATQLLTTAGAAPRQSPKQQLERGKTLIGLRAWDDAKGMLDPLTKSANRALADEARWQSALLLFNRRRHYKQAVAAFDQLAKSKSKFAEEAEYHRARALSRLDRDEEAILAYRRFANRTSHRELATQALFFAARLEFLLGRHKKAQRSFQVLLKQRRLGPSRTRDAHFMAGLLAILNRQPRSAISHLTAASKGTKHPEVLARNRYWSAVARTALDKQKKGAALRDVCREDATTWYARLAAQRLFKLGIDQGPCGLTPLAGEEEEPNTQSLRAIVPLSRRGGFLARAGLFREAALALREAEKDPAVKAETRLWIDLYMALDAPHFAIRRASIGLGWPPNPELRWRAHAAYPTPYREVAQKVRRQHNLPPLLIYAIARKESMFDPHAVSWVGAMGMMQMMPQTYRKNAKRAGLPPLEEGELPDSVDSIRAGGFELTSLLNRYDKSLPLAIMAYNGGSGAVDRWLDRSGDEPMDVFVEKIGFTQTRNYVKRVYQNLVRYRLLAGELPPKIPAVAARPKVDTGQ